jgi:hypothetical protein
MRQIGLGASPRTSQPAPNALLQKWPVSRRVNISKAPADDASLVEKAAA